MKYLLPLSFIVLLTVSCTRYQYLTVRSSDPAVQQNVKDQFVVENDTLLVTYDFKGADLPVSIRISNKLEKPLLVDWKRSSIIINDQSISLKPDEITRGSALSATSGVGRSVRYSDTRTEFSAVTSSPADLEMVPPRAYIEPAPFRVATEYFDNIPEAAWAWREVVMKDGGRVRKKVAVFSEQDSPLRFRTYLTLLTEEKGPAQVVEHSFYLSEILSSGEAIPGHKGPWVAKVSSGGGVVAGVLVAGVIGAAAAAASGEAKNNQGNFQGN
ncbi:MAG: hypothetical protein ACTHMC_17870 [Pseudobacter sp.]|uniref:hypothetical protein n=1 Tax=Pseudobacter sp. TaxID=2045420 RepID=UPI003F7E825F